MRRDKKPPSNDYGFPFEGFFITQKTENPGCYGNDNDVNCCYASFPRQNARCVSSGNLGMRQSVSVSQ